MHIRWIPFQEKGVILLSPKTRKKLKINSEKVTLHLGAWKETFKVKLDQQLNKETIGLPGCLCETFTIPDTLPYEVYVEGEDIHLGPVIAFFVGKGYLSQGKSGKWISYCRNYSKIKGLVYFCTTRGIDTRRKAIKGYYYDPNANPEDQLKFGIFPYPGVVYRRARLKTHILRDLKNHVGKKIFNAHIFNKWEMWKVLAKAGFKHTPFTAMLSGIEGLERMLDLYSSVYLKPATGRFGNGIQKVEKTPEGYVFKGKSGVKQLVKDTEAVFKLIKKYRKRKYIIQQAIPIEFQRTPVDFRVVLQKDGSQQWACSGILARVGKKGRISTNNASSVDLGREALQSIFGLSPEEALQKENEMVRICTDACLIIERAYGNYGDVGIDVLVDQNLRVWILEINKSHQHKMAKYQLSDPYMYERVISRPLEYAKALAGF